MLTFNGDDALFASWLLDTERVSLFLTSSFSFSLSLVMIRVFPRTHHCLGWEGQMGKSLTSSPSVLC